ncbi:MAG: tRNA lysidine(34) synthetase TilS [Alphaproteobacteria bacterium]|nr:tRNA lysidine(34) synthetase TilS [Alphaproteobacteria bacterium]
MYLLREWASETGQDPPAVLCVNHGLRPEAANEARLVARWARVVGLRAKVLRHSGPVPTSDVEAEARRTRYRLMGAWADKAKIGAVYVAHTQDDQAETFLLRLARGSGVDGLAAMRAVSGYPDGMFPNLVVARPLLCFTRQELRNYLTRLAHPWLEDPMNADPRFPRARLRQLWPVLEELGLRTGRIADAAEHLGRAREALDTARDAVIARSCRVTERGILVDSAALTAAPRELGLRALATVLMTVSKAPYRPRFERLERLFDAIRFDDIGGGRTLHGCKLAPAPRSMAVFGSRTLLVRREDYPATARAKPA